MQVFFHIQVFLFTLSLRVLQKQNSLNQSILQALLRHIASESEPVHIKVY